MVISGDHPFLESVYLIQHSIPTKQESGSSPLDLVDMLIVKNIKNVVNIYAFVQEFL